MKDDPAKIIRQLTEDLPKFPDGRYNFSEARKAPVVNCAVYSGGKLLILKRSDTVIAYPGKWNGISGFIDTLDPIEEIARWELKEEAGIDDSLIASLEVLEPHEYVDSQIARTWVVFPVRVLLNRGPEIRLNEEHTEYKWVEPEMAYKEALLPEFINVIKWTMA
ncbi:MAG: NUDIX domain-containing protein [Candidatus Saccharimonadales bacterium]|nr:NUDIX domain-containing protein [Candidatus Saccharimonadales bacterium]